MSRSRVGPIAAQDAMPFCAPRKLSEDRRYACMFCAIRTAPWWRWLVSMWAHVVGQRTARLVQPEPLFRRVIVGVARFTVAVRLGCRGRGRARSRFPTIRHVGNHLALPVLWSRVIGGITRDVEGGAEPVSSLAVHSNVLRCVGEGTTDRKLATDARISRRLAIAAVTCANRRGWITAGAERREREVALTATGQESVETWDTRLRTFDATAAAAELREVAAPIVSRLPLELPWYPASYGTADPSVTGGAFVGGSSDGSVPPHGRDWMPVHRVDGDTVSGVPATALLSQLLVGFAMAYEARPMWPLSSTALVVVHLRGEPMPLDEVPSRHGITGDGKSLLERHGVCVVAPDPANPRRKLVRLTGRGRAISSAHRRALDDVEAAWRDRHGAAVDDLRAVLERHPAASDDTLPDHVTTTLHRG